jgi:hypothetical protein
MSFDFSLFKAEHELWPMPFAVRKVDMKVEGAVPRDAAGAWRHAHRPNRAGQSNGNATCDSVSRIVSDVS